MRITRLFKDFISSEKGAGIILIFCTVLSLCLSNFIIGQDYLSFWHQKIGFSIGDIDMHLSVEHWINDGLMAIFFLLVGLEIERELYAGELSSIKNASLPVIAALGGMFVPALFHYFLNAGTPTQSGFGIPMATDIAFALGILSLAGKRVPLTLKVFLTALAIIDDLGAIMIIALFYTDDVQATYLYITFGIFAVLLLLNRLKVYQLIWYILGGIAMWFCMLQSGIHATITGVLLAFAIPFGDGKENSISYKLQHFLHKPVAFFIIPLFAFANTGIIFGGDINDVLLNNNSLGIMAGLLLGKPIGIVVLCFIAVKVKLASLPPGVSWLQLAGASMLAGIGFTMSIFIALLAFDDATVIQNSKIAILVSSLVAGLAGFLMIQRAVRNAPELQENDV